MVDDNYLACVAGEPSGDLLASSVISAMSRLDGLATLSKRGIGGQMMQAAGFESLWPMEALSVRGYVEALQQLPKILKIRSQLIDYLHVHRPQAYLGVDAPDFNLGVEVQLKQQGIPTIHFISPSIWAWRASRIEKIKQAVDHMLCVFPFEPALYEGTSVKASYVGHPLASDIPLVPQTQLAKTKLGISTDTPVVAVLPGSRHSEIKLIAPTFFQAIALMHQSEPRLEFVLPIATESLKPAINHLAEQLHQKVPGIRLHLLTKQSSLALEASDVVLIASGTATLEAALWKKPMVISYKVPRITAWIMRRQGYLPYVGLPNILLKQFIVPELLQDEATPEALSSKVLYLLDDAQNTRILQEKFSQLHEQLRRPTGELVAQKVHDVIYGSTR